MIVIPVQAGIRRLDNFNPLHSINLNMCNRINRIFRPDSRLRGNDEVISFLFLRESAIMIKAKKFRVKLRKTLIALNGLACAPLYVFISIFAIEAAYGLDKFAHQFHMNDIWMVIFLSSYIAWPACVLALVSMVVALMMAQHKLAARAFGIALLDALIAYTMRSMAACMSC